MPEGGTGAMTPEQVKLAIPHRPPMLLVDEVVQKTDRRILCRKTFRPDEFFFQGHYPDYPLVPGVILCEAAMQSGAILLAPLATEGIPVATRINNVRFRRPVRPGDTIEMDVELVERLAAAFFLKARVTRAGQQVVRFEFACTAMTGQ